MGMILILQINNAPIGLHHLYS